MTAGVICGGVTNSNQTFEYDGTNWTAGGNLGTGMDRTDVAGTGTQTAGLVASGDTTESFTYDGLLGQMLVQQTHYMMVDLIQVYKRRNCDNIKVLPQSPSVTTACETFDGTTFATSATVAQGVYGMGNGGASGTAAFKCGTVEMQMLNHQLKNLM